MSIFIIAEIGINHNGDVGVAKQMIMTVISICRWKNITLFCPAAPYNIRITGENC